MKPWWFHWNRVFFGGVCRRQISTKKTRVSMNTTTGFQVLISKLTREYHHFFVRVSLNTVNKNKIKYEGVSFETIHLVIFGQIFTHEYQQISVNSVSRFSLKMKPRMVSKKLFKIKNTLVRWWKKSSNCTFFKKTVQLCQLHSFLISVLGYFWFLTVFLKPSNDFP